MPVDESWWETLLAQLHELVDHNTKADVVILLGRKDASGLPSRRPVIQVRLHHVEHSL